MHNKQLQKILTSKQVREKFLDYFIHDNDHKFVKSSPVVPMCDSTIAFVNAGMNQFKDIFLGLQAPQYSRVANHQKCVRVGGKHNDLNDVGTDGYHHTFFEMLGNWSFGDYFKREACHLAWELITKEYKLSPSRLYVTYFKGDEKLGLDADVETKEIWQRLGLPENRILPFGCIDNFWEMGLVGPCGPCTEIHVDHLGSNNRGQFVNKGLHDLTEVWNIVFIEYNRNPDGSIVSLPEKHVDTGMGFERLSAILQGKVSNYDSDIFVYLLNAIHKNCPGIPKYGGKFGESDWNGLDGAYRTLADHTRMITACLADGMIPEQNQKFRRILRKSFLLSETVFKKKEGLVKELTNWVVDNLGYAYPEMENHITQVHQIIDYEEAIFKEIRRVSSKEWEKITAENPKLYSLDVIESPSLVTACKEISALKTKEISGEFAFKLYDTHGLDEETIEKLANVLDLKYNPNDLNSELEKSKLRSKKVSPRRDSLINQLKEYPKTADTFKYIYEKVDEVYHFPMIDVTVLGIVVNEKLSEYVKSDTLCSVILDKSNLYTQAGGQSSDIGEINFSDGDFFQIIDTEKVSGCILHNGYFRSRDNKNLVVNKEGVLRIDGKRRLRNMRNHTSTHLLNAELKFLKGATCQKSSKVTDTHLIFDVAIFNSKLTIREMEKLEEGILNLMRNRQPVTVSEVNSQKLLDFDQITTIPGEVYPNNSIRVVEVQNQGICVSREPCCGTHVLNTADIKDFCIISVKSLGRSTASIVAVTGNRATQAKSNGKKLMQDVLNVEKRLKIEEQKILETEVTNLRKRLVYNVTDAHILPVYVKNECKDMLDKISQQIKEQNRDKLKEFIEIEMQSVLQTNLKQSKSNKNYIIHYLRSSMILDSVPLQKATKLCPDVPVLVISYADNVVKARCCVPECLISDSFNAEKWLKESVADVFQSRLQSSKNVHMECNMKEKRVNFEQWESMLDESLKKAERYAEENL